MGIVKCVFVGNREVNIEYNEKVFTEDFYYTNHLDRDSMISITLPEGITEIGEKSLSGVWTSLLLREINLPSALVKINLGAFKNNNSLTEIKLPENLTYIARDAFKSCKNLRSITIPKNITEIYSNTFAKCDKLASVKFPEGLKKIGLCAFSLCPNLEYTLPESVEVVERGAFDRAKYLSNKIPPKLLVLELHALGYIAINDKTKTKAQVYIHENVKSIGEAFWRENKYAADIIISEKFKGKISVRLFYPRSDENNFYLLKNDELIPLIIPKNSYQDIYKSMRSISISEILKLMENQETSVIEQ